MYVVDSSIFASILVKDEFYERARRFLKAYHGRGLVTVATAFLEVGNTVWKHVFVLGRIPKDRYEVLGKSIVPLIRSSVSEIHDPVQLLDEAMSIAAQYRITVYDALFVALARRCRCPIASFDEELRKSLGENLVYIPR